MQALYLDVDGQLVVGERPEPQAGRGEVLVRIQAAALNRRDLWIKLGRYPDLRPPVILGSDGVGTVAACGPGVDAALGGQRVLINPSLDWGPEQSHQGPDFHILGNPRHGTFAPLVAVPASAVHPVPEHLAPAQAAALPLAGLTAYRALNYRAALAAGERVLVTGIGGGVAQMALLFARAMGAPVAVSSGDPEKRQRALAAGASYAADYRDPHWAQKLRADFGAPQVVIDGSGGEGLAQLLPHLAFAARVVIYGATAGEPPSLPLRPLFWKQISVMGSTMGSPQDFAGMLALVRQHQLQPVLDQELPLAQHAQAFARLQDHQHYGKIVLRP